MVSATDRILGELDLSELTGRSIADKALALSQLNQLLKDLSALKAELIQLIAESMTEDQETVMGVGTLVRRKLGTRTKWQGGRILHDLLENFAPVDTETGESLSEPSLIAEKAMQEVYECGGLHRPSHSWGVTALKSRGLKPGDYSDYEEKGVTVDLV